MTRILALNWQDLKHPASGGAEVHLEEILRHLVNKGHDVDLLCCGFDGGADEEIVEGVNIIRRGSRSNFNWIVPFAIKKLTKQKKYDILFEDINKIPFYSPLYLKIPRLVVIPHLFSNTIFKEINFLLGSYIYFFEKPFSLIYKKYNMMVISESTAEEMVERGVDKSLVHVVECGIDHDLYNTNSDTAKFDKPTIIYLGRIKKYKSIETAIDAMPQIIKHVPEARLIIVGTGDHLPVLQDSVKTMHLDERVEFKGFVSHKAKVKLLRQAHLSIYSSLKEGWGLTNIEANACGTPVLAARVPGLRDSVDEGISGLLFEYGNVNEYSEMAIKILSDQKFRSELEQGALKHAAKFSWNIAADQTEKLIEAVLSK